MPTQPYRTKVANDVICVRQLRNINLMNVTELRAPPRGTQDRAAAALATTMTIKVDLPKLSHVHQYHSGRSYSCSSEQN